MDPVAIAGLLLELVLKLVDRETAKKQLDSLAVKAANIAADELERSKFGTPVPPPQ